MTRRTDLGRGDEIALTPGQLASLIVNAWANEVRPAVPDGGLAELQERIAAAIVSARADMADKAHDWLLDRCGDDKCPCSLAGEMHAAIMPAKEPGEDSEPMPEIEDGDYHQYIWESSGE